MPGFAKAPVEPGNFDVQLTVVNGGQLQLWRKSPNDNGSSRAHPRWILTFQPSGQLLLGTYDENTAVQNSSVVLGTFPAFGPNVAAVSQQFNVDGCGDVISVYRAPTPNSFGQSGQHVKIAEFSSSETRELYWVDGVDGGNDSWSVSATVSPSLFCSRSSHSVLQGNQTGLLGVAADTEPVPWWIWLLLALVAFFIVMVLIFGGLAIAFHNKMRQNRVMQPVVSSNNSALAYNNYANSPMAAAAPSFYNNTTSPSSSSLLTTTYNQNPAVSQPTFVPQQQFVQQQVPVLRMAS